MKSTDDKNGYDKIIEQEELYEKSKVVKEAAAVYGAKKQGEYTIEDYYALPDDERVELIDGVFYNMSSPTVYHQAITTRIWAKIDSFIMEKKGKCFAGVAPLDVQLDCDNKTMVQPDVYILCDKSKIVEGRIFGAPDFIVEVLSPSTARKDMGIKAEKYARAGVKEYWIVDGKRKNIIVYTLNEEGYYDVALYTFEDEIPIQMYQGECKIDFKEIQKKIYFIEEK